MPSADLSLLRENVTEGVVPVTDSAGDFSFSGVNSEKPEFRAAVGLSRKWDAREAGREVAIDTLNKLGAGVKPDFFLLFSTIHYEKWGGFKEFLNGVWDILPEGTPLIGGTVAGFICPQGCFTRGAVAVAVSGDMDVAVSFGKNIFRYPRSAGKNVGTMISKKLAVSSKKNKLLFEFISGPLKPRIVTDVRVRSLFEKIPNVMATLISDTLLFIGRKYLQAGASVEEYVSNSLSKILDSYYIVGSSTFDDLKFSRHFQFYNKDVLDRAIVALGISTDCDVVVNKKVSLTPTSKKMNIRTGWDNYSITHINDKPALSQYIAEMEWPDDYKKMLYSQDIGKKTWFYELGFRKDDEIYPIIIGLFFGEILWVGNKIRANEVEVFLTSLKNILDDHRSCLEIASGSDTAFTFFAEPLTIIGMCGDQLYTLKDIIDKILGGSPYLALIGSGLYLKDKGGKFKIQHAGMTMLSIKKSATT